MRVLVVDNDSLMASLIEAMTHDLGHEVVGVVAAAAASATIAAGRPDVVIVDPSQGDGTDVDLVAAAVGSGARAIAYTYHPGDSTYDGYTPRPTVVAKPDLAALERAVSRLGADPVPPSDRDRRRPSTRPPVAPGAPAGLSDARAFYEAVAEGVPGDGLLSVAVVTGGAAGDQSGVVEVAERMREVIRVGDRIMATSDSVKAYLPGAGQEGIESLLQRCRASGALTDDDAHQAVVVEPGEAPSEAFDRLRRMAR